jgi:hypothetical protein
MFGRSGRVGCDGRAELITPSIVFSVPISKIPKMVQETSADALSRGLTACHFGHVVSCNPSPSLLSASLTWLSYRVTGTYTVCSCLKTKRNWKRSRLQW